MNVSQAVARVYAQAREQVAQSPELPLLSLLVLDRTHGLEELGAYHPGFDYLLRAWDGAVRFL